MPLLRQTYNFQEEEANEFYKDNSQMFECVFYALLGIECICIQISFAKNSNDVSNPVCIIKRKTILFNFDESFCLRRLLQLGTVLRKMYDDWDAQDSLEEHLITMKYAKIGQMFTKLMIGI